MNFKPIIIICGEPNSIFSEILVKSFKKYKFKKPIVLIGSYRLISLQLKKLNLRWKINKINNNYLLKDLKKNTVSIIDIDYNGKILNQNHDKLILPHPRMIKRNFVLLPLFEVNKSWKHPKLKINIVDLINSLSIKDLTSIKQI